MQCRSDDSQRSTPTPTLTPSPVEVPSIICLAEFQDNNNNHTTTSHGRELLLKRPRTSKKAPLLPIALKPNEERVSSLPLPTLKLQRRSYRKPMMAMPLHCEMAADPYASPYAGVHYLQEPIQQQQEQQPPRLQQCVKPCTTPTDLDLIFRPLPPGAHLPELSDFVAANDDENGDSTRRFKLKRRPLAVQSSFKRHPGSSFVSLAEEDCRCDYY